ncbi:MAG: phage tail protein [Erysipelotrichaceae bacterium]|nr:phage tail protein [Erysipelotrichaceae bacterium]
MKTPKITLCTLDRTPVCSLSDRSGYCAMHIKEDLSINEITTLSFQYPIVNGGKWTNLQNEQLILFNDEYYKIKNLSINHDEDGNLYVDVSCKHYSDNLANAMISLDEQTPLNVIDLMKIALCYDENGVSEFGWSIGEVTVDRVMKRGLEAVEQSPFSVLLTIAEKFDGILKFNSKTMTIDMLKRQETEHPTFDLRVSKNLKNFNIEYDTSEMYTRLYCYGATDDNGNELDITSVSPDGKPYIENFDYFKTIGYTEEFINENKSLFLSTNIWTDDVFVDAQDLYDEGLNQLAKIAQPTINVSVSALDMGVKNNDITKFDLGACVRVYDMDLGADVLCNVIKRSIDYDNPHVLDCEVTSSITYHDTLSKLFTNVNTVSKIATSGGNLVGGQGTTMDNVKDYLNLYYLNVEQLEANYVKTSTLETYYLTAEQIRTNYLDADSIGAKYATIADLKVVQAKVENLDVDVINAKFADIDSVLADYADVHKLIATDAEIQELKAGNITVAGKLKADKAELEDLIATKVTAGDFEAYKATIENMFALYATIEELETNYLKVNQAEVTYAKITELDTVKGNFETLNADLANLQTLVAKKASIEDLNAANASIKTLQTDLANVNTLVANKVDAEYVQAEIVKATKTITDDLTAIHAIVDVLDTKYATIEQLNAAKANLETLIANKATIEDLNAANANIGNLQGLVANINTILSGSVGTGTLQTIHLTASNVVIDDAVIKSANIENIDVSKLNAGTISTDKFVIQSDNGGILISGSTQQFKDKNGKVRLQVGQDAQGNFNFIVFGEDGTTAIYNENGITQNAVPDGLIVDKMVADDAAIQAKKVQFIDKDGTKTLQTYLTTEQGKIESLIKETTIDNGDGTTTSLKDAYNQTKQTVEGNKTTIANVQTKVNTLTGDVESMDSRITTVETTADGLKTTVSKASSDASSALTTANQTASKFSWIVKSGSSATDFTLTDRTASLVADYINLNGKVTFSGLDSSAQNKINTAQSTANTANSKIDNLKIGGRNLFVFSGAEYDCTKKLNNGITNTNVDGEDNFRCVIQGVNGTTLTSISTQLNITEVGHYSFNFYISNDYEKFVFKHNGSTLDLRIIINKKLEANKTYTVSFDVIGFNSSVIGGLVVDNIKLELGNKATDWTPAPEDKADQSVLDAWNSDTVKSDITTINGGYIRTNSITTNQLDTNEIYGNSAFIGAIQATRLNADMITAGTIKSSLLNLYGFKMLNKITNQESLSITDTGSITMRGSIESYNYHSGKTGWAINSTTDDAEFNNVTVRGSVITNDGGIVSAGGSGRNLLLNSDNGYLNNLMVYSRDDVTYSSEDGWRKMSFSSQLSNEIVQDKWYKPTQLGTYTFSILCKTDATSFSTGVSWFTFEKGHNVVSANIEPLSANLYRITSTYTISTLNNIRIVDLSGFNTTEATYVSFRFPKLEEGNVATDWSLAPEDKIKQVRFWAGTSYEERESAPFIVYNDGSIKATQGNFSGVFSGTVDIGNIKITDPSATAGGDALLTIQNGNNGIKKVQLKDTEYSSFAQNLIVSDNAYNTMIELGQNGYGTFKGGINVNNKIYLESSHLTINGNELTTNSYGFLLNSPQVDVGTVNNTSVLNVYGQSNVNGELKVTKLINYNDTVVATIIAGSSGGIDLDFVV